jgi:hypothetical protein
MLLIDTKNLNELLIRALASKPMATANWLQSEITRHHRRFTIQGIYKELRSLIQAGVVIKIGECYSLSLPWVLALTELSDRMFGTYIDNLSADSIFPAKKRKHTWNFDNLGRLNDLWAEIYFLLFQKSPTRRMRQWVAYPIFWFVHRAKPTAFLEGLRAGGYSLQGIFYERSEIADDYFRFTEQSKASYELFFAKSPFHSEISMAYGVIDDYLVTLQLPEESAHEIQRLFQMPKSKSTTALVELSALVRAPMKCKLTLERGTARFHRVKRQFDEYFL